MAAMAATTLGLASSPAAGTVVWDEAVNGDLSNSGTTATAVTFGLGSNVVQGTTGHDVTGAIDRDISLSRSGQTRF